MELLWPCDTAPAAPAFASGSPPSSRGRLPRGCLLPRRSHSPPICFPAVPRSTGRSGAESRIVPFGGTVGSGAELRGKRLHPRLPPLPNGTPPVFKRVGRRRHEPAPGRGEPGDAGHGKGRCPEGKGPWRAGGGPLAEKPGEIGGTGKSGAP
jgi:hypothetical protein